LSDIKKRIAGEYAAMMQSEAWKDLEAWSKLERAASFQRVDDKPINELIVPFTCEERGIRKGILKVLQHAEQCREGV
jgi:hypothetical protein